MARAEYRKSNGHFKFYNENPKGSLRACDCVIRALGYANDGYNNVYKELCDIGFELKDIINSKPVYEKYLTKHNWVKQKQPKKANGKKYTLKEFCKFYKDMTIIVSVANHMTVIENGFIIDTWDCGDKCVGNYWVKH